MRCDEPGHWKVCLRIVAGHYESAMGRQEHVVPVAAQNKGRPRRMGVDTASRVNVGTFSSGQKRFLDFPLERWLGARLVRPAAVRRLQRK